MKKQTIFLAILCVLILCFFVGCDATLSLSLGWGDKSTGEGTGMFSSDLSDEERAVCETLIKEQSPKADLSPFAELGYSDAQIETSVYYLRRTLNVSVLKKLRKKGDLDDNFSLSADFLIVLPVFAEKDGKRTVAGAVHLPLDSKKDEPITISDEYTRLSLAFITEALFSPEAASVYCEEHDLGTPKTLSFMSADSMHTRTTSFLAIVIETDKGNFVCDPALVMERLLEGENNLPEYGTEVQIFEGEDFLDAYFDLRERRADFY